MHRISKLLLAGFSAWVSAPQAARLQIDEQTRATLGTEFSNPGSEPASPGSANAYRVLARPFDTQEWSRFAAGLGFPAAAESREQGAIKTFHVPGKIAGFDRSTSELFFSDESAPDLDPGPELSDDAIQSQSDRILKNLLRDDAKNYVLMNCEKTFMQASSYERPVPIAYIANYLRVMDGRPILSGEGNATVEFGKGGAIKRFSVRKPIFEVSAKLAMTSPRGLPGKLAALAEKQVDFKSTDGPVPILGCKPIQRTPSYISLDVGGEKVLMPYTTFLSRMELDPFTIHASSHPEAPSYFITHLNVPDAE